MDLHFGNIYIIVRGHTGHAIPLVNVFGNGGLHGQGHVRPIRKFFSFHISSKYILEMAEDMSKDKLYLKE